MRNRKKGARASLLVILVLTIPLAGILHGCSSMLRGKVSASSKRSVPKDPYFSTSDRILVIAPHPDDETLACGGFIKRAVSKKVPTTVVLITSGDGYIRNCEIAFRTTNPSSEEFRKIGVARRLLTIAAMKEVGLKKKNIIFLCYPDGATNSLFNKSWDYSNPHRGLNGATHASYSYAYEKGAAYCGESVVKDLTKVIKNFKPTIILYPDPGDDHHDHWATSAFVEYVLAKIDYKARQFTFLVHKGFNWPLPWAYAPSSKLQPPPELLTTDAKWMKFSLSRDEENRKHKAIDHYASQNPLMADFFNAFIRRNELFAKYPALMVKRTKREPDFFLGKRLPALLFVDPKGDTLRKEFEQFGDLTATGLTLNRKAGWMALETRDGIAPEVIYAFHLRIFGKQRVRRVDIRVEKGNAVSEILAKNSESIRSPIQVTSRDKRLVVQIPAGLFKDADQFLFNADTYVNKRRIDRTAWRRVQLK